LLLLFSPDLQILEGMERRGDFKKRGSRMEETPETIIETNETPVSEANPTEEASKESTTVQEVASVPVEQTPEVTLPPKDQPESPTETARTYDPDLVSRLGELEAKIKDYESRELKRQIDDREAAERAREALLSDFGILDPLYSRLAPSIQEADPRTPEGKETIRQWMTKHPNLFKKSPGLKELTDAAGQKSGSTGNRFNKSLTFGDAIRKLRG
jgi:hypothetical protein